MSSLTVYKASAGSGKTFKLAQQYLLMVLKNPSRYRNILAVTFTNKATAEMKNRIIRELYILSQGKKSEHATELKALLNMTDPDIKKQASHAMNLILHDYSRFSVSTIDHFFQRVIRTFAREIGLQAGYNLEMDQSEILGYVVDELLLAASDDAQLRKWLVEFAHSRITEGKSWDFRNEILSLAGELSTEQVKDLSIELVDAIRNRDILTNYVKSLNKIVSSFESTLKDYGVKAVQIVENAGLTPKDFKYNGNAVNWFYYLKEKRKNKFEPGKNTLKALDDPGNWPKPKLEKDKEQLITGLATENLMPILQDAVDFYENNSKRYFSALEVKKNIYVLGILVDIQKRMDAYCKEKNLFLISDAADLLRKIIGDNDAPFVYEKTGSIYQHFMIDEFQDTSRFQWDNFKPLIQNSLSENGRNVLVGDIKQSIYRWRNSDWKILAEEVERGFSGNSAGMEYLDANFRSTKNIVAYNNTIFSFAPEVLQNQFNSNMDGLDVENLWTTKLKEAYSDVKQKLPFQKDGGYVRSEGIIWEKGGYDEAKEKIKEKLIDDIEMLQDKGYNLSEIAVLVRKNNEGQEIANAILEYKNSKQARAGYQYDVVSNDSLYIRNAKSVKLLLALFRFFIDPDDQVNNAFIKELYHRTILQKDINENNIHRLLVNGTKEDFENFMPAEFIDNLDQLKRTPIYELVERLVHIFKINAITQEVPYLNAFQNIILDFSRHNASDLSTFINWWDSKGHTKKLQLPEDYNAIRIITIHKAKGLEFKAVLLPFTNWELDNPSFGIRKNFIWVEPQDEQLKELRAVPVNYKSSLSSTIFAEEYYSELFHNYVDNLNLIYVAFTRAEEVLINYFPLQVAKNNKLNYLDKGKGVTHVGELLHFVFENQFPGNESNNEKPVIDDLHSHWNNEQLTFEWGRLDKVSTEDTELQDHLKLNEYPAYIEKPAVRLKYEHTEFFKEKPDLMGRLDYGKIMHQIFEHITVDSDVDDAVERAYFEGKINNDEKKELKNQIQGLFQNDQVKDWFSGRWKVYSEREILIPRGDIYRPDRVMMRGDETIIVDYKFGEKHNQYKMKVRKYMEQLHRMGYKNVTGYLWYVSRNEIENVEK